MLNLNKFNNIFFSYNTLLLLVILLFVIINFIIFKNSKILTINIILLIIIYICLIKKSTKEKKLIFITLVHFAFWGPLIESLLIHKSKLLSYTHKDINRNIPLWLPTAYALFAITTLYTYDLFKHSLM